MSEQKSKPQTLIRSVTASTKPTKIADADSKRTGIYVQVTDSATAYITSNQSAPYTEGYKVSASLPFERSTTKGELWILTSSSTAACIVQIDTE